MLKRIMLLAMCAAMLLPALAMADTATLTWEHDDTTVLGYKVYCGTSSGQYGAPIDVGNVKNYIMTLPNSGEDHTYYFAVTAYNKAGESAKSEEASKLFPGMPPSAPTHVVITLSLQNN